MTFGPSNPPGVDVAIQLVLDSAEIGASCHPSIRNNQLGMVFAETLYLVAKNPEAYRALRKQLEAFVELGDQLFPEPDAFDEAEAQERNNWAKYGQATNPTKSHPGHPNPRNSGKPTALQQRMRRQAQRDGLA